MNGTQLQVTVEEFKEACKNLSQALQSWSRQSATSFPQDSLPQLRNCLSATSVLQNYLDQIQLNEPQGLHLMVTHNCKLQAVDVKCTCVEWSLSRPDQGDFSIPIVSPCGQSLQVRLLDKEENTVESEGLISVWLASEQFVKSGTMLQEVEQELAFVQNLLVAHSQCELCQQIAGQACNKNKNCKDPRCVKDKPFMLLTNLALNGQPSIGIDVVMKDGVADLGQILLTKCGERHKQKQIKSEAMQLLVTMQLQKNVLCAVSPSFKTITERAIKAQKRKWREQQQNLQHQYEQDLDSPHRNLKIKPIVSVPTIQQMLQNYNANKKPKSAPPSPPKNQPQLSPFISPQFQNDNTEEVVYQGQGTAGISNTDQFTQQQQSQQQQQFFFQMQQQQQQQQQNLGYNNTPTQFPTPQQFQQQQDVVEISANTINTCAPTHNVTPTKHTIQQYQYQQHGNNVLIQHQQYYSNNDQKQQQFEQGILHQNVQIEEQQQQYFVNTNQQQQGQDRNAGNNNNVESSKGDVNDEHEKNVCARIDQDNMPLSMSLKAGSSLSNRLKELYSVLSGGDLEEEGDKVGKQIVENGQGSSWDPVSLFRSSGFFKNMSALNKGESHQNFNYDKQR